MKKAIIIALFLLIPSIVWAGEYCAICDKRFGKWVPYFSSLFSGDMMFSTSSPSGSWHGTPKVKLHGESEIEVCPECAEKYDGIYKHNIDQCKKEFIQHRRLLESYRIEQNRKDNAAYKEKQDEIDKLQNRIRELELERQGVFPFKSGTSEISGVSEPIKWRVLP